MNDHPSEPLEGDSLDKLNNIDLSRSPDNWSDWFSYISLKVSVDQLLFFSILIHTILVNWFSKII
ncbi:unnamed protein product [Schistosoma curassoni]|uniref:Uncharacterized protein n=1 Tax=Schistosoma curassoni TaxID=6186 RepID=A0A183JRQ9_9TREM|nr:unnamed protein product [Schistosoma curassoni]